MIWRQLGFAYEKQKKSRDASQAYALAGDRAGVRRVDKLAKP